MTKRYLNRPIDNAIFWICLFLLIGVLTQATWQNGEEHGKQSCKAPTQKSGYDMTKRQLRRMIKYELARGMK